MRKHDVARYKLSEASVCIFMAQSTVAIFTVLEAMQPIPTAWKFKKNCRNKNH